MISINATMAGRIKEVIEKLFDTAVFDLLGESVFDQKKVIMFSAGKPNYDIISLFIQALNNKEPNPREREALKHIIRSTQSYIDSLKDKTVADTLQIVTSLVNKGKVDSDKLSEAISEKMDKVSDHLALIVDTQTNLTRNVGAALEISKVGKANGVEDPNIFFIVKRDSKTCKHCIQNHLMPDETTPRVFKLSEVGYNFLTHADREAGKVSLAGIHPKCRCSCAFLSPGFGFKNGKLTWQNIGWDEYEKQRS